VDGITIAILVATPEAIGAVRTALANRAQRSINVFLVVSSLLKDPRPTDTQLLFASAERSL
jgi:hypothetical protein